MEITRKTSKFYKLQGNCIIHCLYPFFLLVSFITMQCRGFANQQAWSSAGRIVHKSLELCHLCREKGLCSRNTNGILWRPLLQEADGESRKTISPTAGLGGTLRTQLLRLFYKLSTQRATVFLPFFLIFTSWNSDQTPDTWSPYTFISPPPQQPRAEVCRAHGMVLHWVVSQGRPRHLASLVFFRSAIATHWMRRRRGSSNSSATRGRGKI